MDSKVELQQYLLVTLMEELSELQQAVSKCYRFSPDHTYEMYEESNIQRLQNELNDVLALMHLLERSGLKIHHPNEHDINGKVERVKKMMRASIMLERFSPDALKVLENAGTV